MSLIMGLDLGTSSLKIMLMDECAKVISSHSVVYPSIFPQPGWVEQRPADWENAMRSGISSALECVDPKQIAAISFSGHMSGVVLVGRDGVPLANCITLADGRSDEECEWIRSRAEGRIFDSCKNPVINAFAAPKLLWLLRHKPEAMKSAAAYLAPKDYLRYLLTGVMYAEATDAANSLLFRPAEGRWDTDLIRTLGLPERIFPPVLKPFDEAGAVTEKAARVFSLPAGTPVIAGAADMACGALGICVNSPGDTAVTLGTSATFLTAAHAPSAVGRGQITWHLHAVPDCYYALGSHFNGGLALNWFVSQFSEDGSISYELSDRLAALAEKIPNGRNPVLNLPFFVGSGTPYFDSSDAAAFLGVSQSCRRGELFKSILEGVALNLLQTLNIFEELHHAPLSPISLGGGGVKVAGWSQIITDVFGRRTRIIRQADASTVGACILGGYGAGIFRDMAEAARHTFEVVAENDPDPSAHQKYLQIHRLSLRAYRELHQIQRELRSVTTQA